MTQATNINVNPELVSEKSIGNEPFLVLNPCINIFISNLLGLFPFAFTVTSHILITGFIAFFAFVGLTIRGFYLYKINFLKVYIISGVPTYLLPVLVVIELLSY